VQAPALREQIYPSTFDLATFDRSQSTDLRLYLRLNVAHVEGRLRARIGKFVAGRASVDFKIEKA
jgi:hypothetical protein